MLSHLCYPDEIQRRGGTQQEMTTTQDITTIITGSTAILGSKGSLVKQARGRGRGRGRERRGTVIGYKMKQDLGGNQLMVTQQAAEREVHCTCT